MPLGTEGGVHPDVRVFKKETTADREMNCVCTLKVFAPESRLYAPRSRVSPGRRCSFGGGTRDFVRRVCASIQREHSAKVQLRSGCSRKRQACVKGLNGSVSQFEDTLPLYGTPLDEQGHGYGQREGQRSIGDDKRSPCSKIRRQHQPSTQASTPDDISSGAVRRPVSVGRLANNLSSKARWKTGGHHVLEVVAGRRCETLNFVLSVQALKTNKKRAITQSTAHIPRLCPCTNEAGHNRRSCDRLVL